MFNLFSTPKQAETFCPSCNSFYMDFVSNVNVTTYANNDKFYHATCYQCLNAKDDFQMLVGYLIFFASYIAYYVFMETKYQKTIGKFITKTKVVNKNGTKPEVGDILRRTFCRLIPFDRISFLFTSNGFHDRLSDTTIIKDDN